MHEDDDLSIDNPFFTMSDGEEVCAEELALAKLLIDEVCFPNGRQYVHHPDGPLQPETVVLYVICNDLFYWGCADAEDLPLNEVGRLYKMHKADPHYGAAKWCCLRRGMRPQPPVEKRWRASGHWDEELEALPSRTT